MVLAHLSLGVCPTWLITRRRKGAEKKPKLVQTFPGRSNSCSNSQPKRSKVRFAQWSAMRTAAQYVSIGPTYFSSFVLVVYTGKSCLQVSRRCKSSVNWNQTQHKASMTVARLCVVSVTVQQITVQVKPTKHTSTEVTQNHLSGVTEVWPEHITTCDTHRTPSYGHWTYVNICVPCLNAHRAELISVSSAVSQTPVYTASARPQTEG